MRQLPLLLISSLTACGSPHGGGGGGGDGGGVDTGPGVNPPVLYLNPINHDTAVVLAGNVPPTEF